MTGTFLITGSHGTLIACRVTGQVLALTDDGDDKDQYRDIEAIDVAELWGTYGPVADGAHFDILDCGFWTARVYEPPAHDWREECAFATGDKLFR